jgi:hypothetical protein
MALTMVTIPDSFGKGGSNIGDGDPTIAAVLQQIRADLIELYAAAAVGTLTANALSADLTGRAVMATGYFTEAKATDAFAAQAITGALLKNSTVTPTQLATVVMGAPTTRSGAGAVPITAPTCLLTTTGTGDALTVADGTYAGQRLLIKCVVDGGTGVITQTTGAKLRAAVTSITFTNVGDWLLLEWSGTLWNDVAQSGVTIATS